MGGLNSPGVRVDRNMFPEFKNFQIMINMKDYTKIVILMDLVYELILMGIFIKDNLTMVIDMEKELLS